MSPTVEFLYDYASPYAFLASETLSRRLPGIPILYKPIYLRGLDTFSKGMPFVPAKLQYMGKDLSRIAKREGVPHKLPSNFPVNGVYACRGDLWVQKNAPKKLQDYHRALFRAAWAENKNISDKSAVAQLAGELGIDALAFAAGIDEEPLKEQLKAQTADAAKRGVFGVPTFFVGNEMFWGHDRMDYVLEAARAAG